MDTTILTNALLAIVSIFLVFVIVVFAILSLYIIKIIKSIDSFLKTIKKGSEKIEMDIENVREKIKNGEAVIVSSVLYVASLLKKHWKKSTRNNINK